jgi:geranylgeranyl pyrophosphate synthase
VQFGDAAKRHLRAFPPSHERDALTALADYVLSRDR